MRCLLYTSPLQTAFQQRHTVTLEGGDEALRYRMYVGYNSSPGVMKDLSLIHILVISTDYLMGKTVAATPRK